MTEQALEMISVVALLAGFEMDIRYGGHSTIVEASRSSAGKELCRRGEEAIKIITHRLQEMNERPPKDSLEARVRDGVEMLLCWMTPDRIASKKVGSADFLVTMQAALSR
jgi:hypothetical protein